MRSIADELKELGKLRRDGVLSEAEFESAKQRVIGEEVSGEDHLADITQQNRIAQLDREWELEREDYMIATKYGGRRIPEHGVSVVSGVVVAVLGLFWTFRASSMVMSEGLWFFPAFGVVFVALGVGSSIRAFNKATRYEEGQRVYRERRAELLEETLIDRSDRN